MSLENCLNLSLLIDSFILINLLRNVQIVGPLYRIDCLPISYLTRGITNWLPLRESLLPDFKVNKDARSSGTLCLITSNMNSSKRLL